jgi:tetratricopeptide (TPR) repeat protein
LQHNARHAGAAAALSLAYSLRYANDGRDEVWLQRADASAQQAVKQDDQLSLAHAAQGWVRELQGKMDESMLLAERALKLDPHSLFALDGKGQLLLRMHRFDELETLMQGAIKAHPKERMFVNLFGTLRYRQGNYVEAEKLFRHSIRLDPDSAVSYANLNAALLRQNRPDDALQVLQQGLQVRPSGRLYDNLGTALFARGDYVAAARAYEQAVSAGKGSPNDYIKWANLADTLRWIPGRGDESRLAYQRAADLLKIWLARSPNESVLQSRMGLYAAKLGDREGAESWGRRALASAPTSPDVHFRAAVAHEVGGQRADALRELAQARALGYPASAIDSEPDLLDLRRDIRYHHPTKEAAK